MAIVRNPVDPDNPVNYVATLAFFCCVSCVVLMLRFGAFRARFNVSSKSGKDEDVPVVCISGSYRAKTDEFFDSGRAVEPPKKITPSMVKLPLNNNPMKPSKSTSNLREPEFVPVTMHKSTPDISFDPRGGRNNIPEVELRNPEKSAKELKKEEQEKAKLEKKRQAEQKAREKAAKEQAKKEKAIQDKERAKKENDKKEKKTKIKKEKKTKSTAPPAPPLPQSAPPLPQSAPPLPQSAAPVVRSAPALPQSAAPVVRSAPALPQSAPPLAQGAAQESSSAPKPVTRKKRQSDINRSSGPPPYSELPEPIPGNTSNVSYGKPINNPTSSWDMVSQHRQQMSRPTATIGGGGRKQMVMDLQYNFNKNVDNKDNSEA